MSSLHSNGTCQLGCGKISQTERCKQGNPSRQAAAQRTSPNDVKLLAQRPHGRAHHAADLDGKGKAEAKVQHLKPPEHLKVRTKRLNLVGAK